LRAGPNGNWGIIPAFRRMGPGRDLFFGIATDPEKAGFGVPNPRKKKGAGLVAGMVHRRGPHPGHEYRGNFWLFFPPPRGGGKRIRITPLAAPKKKGVGPPNLDRIPGPHRKKTMGLGVIKKVWGGGGGDPQGGGPLRTRGKKNDKKKTPPTEKKIKKKNQPDSEEEFSCFGPGLGGGGRARKLSEISVGVNWMLGRGGGPFGGEIGVKKKRKPRLGGAGRWKRLFNQQLWWGH